MELKDLLGDELFSQVDAKIQEHNGGVEDKLKHVRFVDLSEGGYISQEKYQTLSTKAKGYEEQLNTANTTIKSYKDLDIDGIKNSVSEWETKYKTDTENLQTQLDTQQKTFAAEKFLDGYKIKSPFARKAILSDLMSQNFELKEDTFVGADDWMKKLKEQSPNDFEAEKEPGQEKPKSWVRGTQNTYKPQNASAEEAYLQNKYGNNKYAKK